MQGRKSNDSLVRVNVFQLKHDIADVNSLIVYLSITRLMDNA